MKFVLLAAALAGAILPRTALAASSTDYRNCDGYGAAAGSGDGMTSWATVGLIFSPPGYGNTDRAAISENANAAIAGCDAALAELTPKWWMRKVSLLRARAIHRMAQGDKDGAKADLDLAEAAAQTGDILYDRSLGWGLIMTRAFWMVRNGDRRGGEALAMQTLAKRPWNRQAILTAMAVLGDGATDENRRIVLRDLVRLMPSRLTMLYLDAYDNRHYDQTVALYGGLTPNLDVTNSRDAAEIATVRWRNERHAQQFKVLTGGMYAYALAAIGRGAEARATIAAIRESLAQATRPPAPLTEKEARDREKVAIHDGDVQNRQRAAEEGTKVLDQWSREVDLRIAVDEGRPAEVIAALPDRVLIQDWASVELLDAATQKLPPDQRPATPYSDGLRGILAKQEKPYTFPYVMPAAFLGDLPEAESTRRLTDWAPVSFSLFGTADQGFSATKPDADGAITVSFRGDQTSTGSMVEEMVLLRVAELARQAGKKSLVITDRHDVRNTITTTYLGQPVRTDPNGYFCSLTVLLVDAPPKIAEGSPWRLIDADAIYAELAPIYIPAKLRK
jgi:hypothetical protein